MTVVVGTSVVGGLVTKIWKIQKQLIENSLFTEGTLIKYHNKDIGHYVGNWLKN